MTHKMLKLLCAKLVLLALTPVAAQQFVLKPRPPMETHAAVGDPFAGDANVVHNYPVAPSQVRARNPLRDWKFWAGSGVAFGAMAYDWHQTVSYRGTACVEANIENNPHPGYGALAKKDLPIQFGLFGLKYVLARYAKVPWWSYETTDGIAAAIHIHSGMMWDGCAQ